MSKLFKQIIFVYVFLILSYLSNAQLILSLDTETSGTSVTTNFKVENFENIISMQFSIHWESSVLGFEYIDNFNPEILNLSQDNFELSFTSNGLLTFSWYNLSGISLPDDATAFSLHFNMLSGDPAVIQITSSPTHIEILNEDGEITPVLNSGYLNSGEIRGKVYFDENNNCAYESGEIGLSGWKVIASGESTYYGVTNSLGQYVIPVLPGNFDLSIVQPNTGWSTCSDVYHINVPNVDTEISIDIPAQSVYDCPQPEVSISTPFLRRCANNFYEVYYCNKGTIVIEQSYVEVTFDPFVEYISSDIPWSDINDNTYTFDIGELEIGECGNFKIYVSLSCDAVLGQTHCITANIFPQDYCSLPDDNWDGSNLRVNSQCSGDSIHLLIKNIGDDMIEPVDFIIIEDVVVGKTGSIMLNSDESYEETVPANGSTWRIEVEQSPYFPGNSKPSLSVEGCGTNDQGEFSLGYVTQYPMDDADPFVDIDCQENIGSFDTNEKRGYPKGYQEEHLIERGQEIEYLIHFQNIGTDTAKNVFILDTISQYLDISTARKGAASHFYQLDIIGENVLKFTFNNIELLDSTTNEQLSHAFLKFQIEQMPELPLGTVIENRAAVYFDFSEPVFTNTTFHTIGVNFIISAIPETKFIPELNVEIFPNPFYENTEIKISGIFYKKAVLKIFDISGKQIFTEDFKGSSMELYNEGFQSGFYTYLIEIDGKRGNTGKLIVR